MDSSKKLHRVIIAGGRTFNDQILCDKALNKLIISLGVSDPAEYL